MENLEEYLEKHVKEYQILSDEYDYKLEEKRKQLSKLQNEVLSLETYFNEYDSDFNIFYKVK